MSDRAVLLCVIKIKPELQIRNSFSHVFRPGDSSVSVCIWLVSEGSWGGKTVGLHIKENIDRMRAVADSSSVYLLADIRGGGICCAEPSHYCQSHWN